MDNQGSYLDFVGEFNAKDGQMILARESAKPDGTKSMQRMVFKNISHDEFDWSWEASSDEGKNWISAMADSLQASIEITLADASVIHAGK